MREFRGFEYVDGDLKVYAREKGQGDDAWRELGVIPLEHRRLDFALALVPGPVNDIEQAQLDHELTWPRRW